MRGLDGKVILVTGGANGIGLATCRRLAEEGARVAVLDLDREGSERVADELRSNGGAAWSGVADIRDTDAVESFVAGARAALGPIDGLVNNAGWDLARNFLDTDPELWRKVIDINLFGPVNVTKAVLPEMVERGAGRVVAIASDAGRVGSSGESVYAGCKAGVIAFLKSVAREVARTGVTLNVVSPGPTDTELFRRFDESGKLAAALQRAIPMGRLGQPEDVPGAIAFLLSDDAAFITGQVISVSGGLTMHG